MRQLLGNTHKERDSWSEYVYKHSRDQFHILFNDANRET